ARQRLFGLNNFNAIGHTGGEAVLAARQAFRGEFHVFASYADLLRRCTQVEKRGADVVIDLPPNILCFGAALPQGRLRLSYVALDLSAGEDRETDPGLEFEGSS